MQDPTGAIAWYNNSSLRPPQPQQRPSLGPGPLLSPRGGQKIRENAADNDIGGPIYEDIDRMCSYRGYPPPGKNTKDKVDPYTLGDFRNISTIFIFLLAVPPYNFCNFDTKMV